LDFLNSVYEVILRLNLGSGNFSGGRGHLSSLARLGIHSYHLVSHFSSSLSSPNPVSKTLLAPLYESNSSTTLADSLKNKLKINHT